MAPNGNGHSDNFQLQEWKGFYLKIWNKDAEISESIIPKNKKDGFNQLIVMLEGMTLPKIVAKIREHMKVRLWENEDWLEEIESDREVYKQSYGIWIRGERESDERLAGLSAVYLEDEKIPGITLSEHLMFALFYWWKFKEHIDLESVTLCSGSRHLDMRKVPWVLWNYEKDALVIFWFLVGFSGGGLRTREVVA